MTPEERSRSKEEKSSLRFNSAGGYKKEGDIHSGVHSEIRHGAVRRRVTGLHGDTTTIPRQCNGECGQDDRPRDQADITTSDQERDAVPEESRQDSRRTQFRKAGDAIWFGCNQ